jgi:hypothetical protein
MRLHAIVWAALLGATVFAQNVRISPRYQSVYVLPMGGGLDQHLSNRLTISRALWVVLEPGSADAVLTDTLDETFWSWLSRTYPGAAGSPANHIADFPHEQPIVRNRGTVFLVDPRRRVVLWSTYALPKNTSPDELDRTATRVTTQLKAAYEKK